MITVIYTNWKRPFHLMGIIEACKAQRCEKEIWLIDNADAEHRLYHKDTIRHGHNNELKCWQRWMYAVQATTPYVCIMDDDLIFGNRDILTTCSNYLEAHPYVDIVGHTGVIYKGSYLLGQHFHHATTATKVDIVKGRFMFLRTSALEGLDMTPDLTCDDIKISAHVKGHKHIIPLQLMDLHEGDEALFRQPGQQQLRELAGKKYFW